VSWSDEESQLIVEESLPGHENAWLVKDQESKSEKIKAKKHFIVPKNPTLNWICQYLRSNEIHGSMSMDEL